MNQEQKSTYQRTQIADTENFVLSAMLLKNGECIPKVLELLNADDFAAPANRIFFAAIVKIFLRGEVPNVLTLSKDLMASGEFDKVGIEKVYSLTEWANTTAYVEQFCKDIKAASDNRKLIEIASKIAQNAREGVLNPSDIVRDTQAALDALQANYEVSQLTDANSYLEHDFFADLEDEANSAVISTGFWNLDQNLPLTPGLYIFGAEPAMGKTTFIWQLLENLARDGCSCVYCSYEMSKKAMFRKSVARTIFTDIDPTTELTAANLHNNFKYLSHEMTIRGAVNKIRDANMDLKVLELHGENIDNLIRKLTPLANTDKQLVICIDYVQIVAVEGKDGKAAVDEVLRRLSVFQRDTNSIIFVVSSFNRAGYRQPISYSSFKESGALEYSAVALLGLQLAAVNKISGKENAIELDKIISAALKAQPRQVILRCIKYRNGSNFDCFFNYYSAHDTFEPCDGFLSTDGEDIADPPAPSQTVGAKQRKNQGLD